MKNKKGIFFSMDALVALSIILIAILVAYPLLNTKIQDSYSQSDLINALSSLQVKELNNSYMNTLISNGQITDQNKTVLEQIGELYVLNESAARNLTISILNDIETNENLGIWFGDKFVAGKNSTAYHQGSNVIVESQTISGIQEGESITAFSGRAFLKNSLQATYFYFGGYVGEGNISANITYLGNISAATMELAITQNFSVYVNGNYEGDYTGSASTYTPETYNIPTANFSSGSNLVELRGNFLSIAGGYIKVSYEPEVSYSQPTRKFFPGIDGIVNLYDGFYIPGQLNSLNIFLRYNNNVSTFLRIGDVIVYNDSTNGTENITINNTELSALLNYTALSETTIPLRLGLANASYIQNLSRPADVFSVVDLSGSMAPSCSGGGFWCCLFSGNFCGSATTCGNCGGTWDDPLGTAQNATKNFTASILNDTENQVGLTGYASSVNVADTHNLSRNQTTLDNEVDSWSAGGGTCICCGINWAASSLVNESSSQNFRSLVVMSDGQATATCPEQPNSTAEDDAIQAACDAFQDHDIRVYAVGFGAGADEDTLQEIANCGGGSYYYGSVSNLVSVYEDIAQEIIDASFFEQTLNVTGDYSSRLHPESYIEFDYNETALPFGLITTSETLFDNDLGGQLNLPTNASIIETQVISYSGARWTDSLTVNNNVVYNLSTYGSDYLDLGDPYTVQIPNSFINETANNVINLTTALSPENSSGGSANNKIIYTILQDDVTAYSSLATSAQGCNWTIEFEDNSNLSTSVPATYTGADLCNYRAAGQNISNSNDALQTAVLSLFQALDYDDDGRLDVAFSDQDLQISSAEITGIPFDWSTVMQVRVWK